MKLGLLLVLIMFLPRLVEAVSISEVAWMGDQESANHEWIELYNAGEAVSVDGWTLTDGMNLNIALSGQVSAGAYVVLERTSEESAPGSAFLIYTGAIVNTGATLVLRNTAGEVIDQVAGGENWQNIGGDNVTKETAQYKSSGWVTDTPTPGRENGAGRINPPTTEPPKNNTTSANSSSKKSVTTPLVEKPSKLVLNLKRQEVAYVGQPIKFLAEVSGYPTNESNLLRYAWNFGDTHATSGVEVWHTYNYPGEYVVTVATKRGRDEQVARAEVTVLPVTLSISYGVSGVVHVNNDAPYDIDVSGYRLVATKVVLWPERSLIKAGGTVTFGSSDLGSWAHGVKLFDRDGNLVFAKYNGQTELYELSDKPSSETQSQLFIKEVVESPLVSLATTSYPNPTTSVVTFYPESDNEVGDINNRRTYLILILLLLFGLMVLYATKNRIR